MAKIVLGQKPANFTKPVEIELLDGSKTKVTFSFIYRTRKDYAALMDETIGQSKEESKPVKKDLSAVEAFENTSEATATFIMKVCDGWEFKEDFNKENLKELLETYPQFTSAIGEVYRLAILEGRTKN